MLYRTMSYLADIASTLKLLHIIFGINISYFTHFSLKRSRLSNLYIIYTSNDESTNSYYCNAIVIFRYKANN